LEQFKDYNHEKSKIYGANSSKEPTVYQQKVNEAYYHLALKDPSLLSHRQKLLDSAQLMVNQSGYEFKRVKKPTGCRL